MSSLKPLNRKELYAAAIAGEGEAPKALNRKELFATAIAGEGEAPSPLNRREIFASEIAGNISGGTNLKLICKTDKCSLGDTIDEDVKNCIDNAYLNYVFYVCMYENDNERFSYTVGRCGRVFIDDKLVYSLSPFSSDIDLEVALEATSGKVSRIYYNRTYRDWKCEISVYEFNSDSE